MDSTAIAIAVIGSAIFIGVIVWKGLWFLRKIQEPPEPEFSARDPSERETDAQETFEQKIFEQQSFEQETCGKNEQA